MINIKNLNIGVTVSLKDDSSVWSNGIIQNSVYLYKTLVSSNNNYNVSLCNCTGEEIPEEIPWAEDINLVRLKDVMKDLDLLILIGAQVTDNDINYIKNNGCKVVFYQCGSNYVLNMEDTIFKEEVVSCKYTRLVDEIWMIPQNEEVNYHYFKAMHNTHTVVVPFLWDPMFLDLERKKLHNGAIYESISGPKRLSVFEPNMNIVKFFMYPLIIADRLDSENPELIKRIFLTNTIRHVEKTQVVSLVSNLDIVKTKVATFEQRYITPHFLANNTDVVISHQWGNPLNYAYLDALYLGYPLVHNAHMCSDAGYYYEGFDVDEGVKQLRFAIKEHDYHLEEYKYRSETVLNRFKCDNPHTIVYYDKLIHNVMNGIKNEYSYKQKNNF
jgi:Protein of unknown function (DUF2827)